MSIADDVEIVIRDYVSKAELDEVMNDNAVKTLTEDLVYLVRKVIESHGL